MGSKGGLVFWEVPIDFCKVEEDPTKTRKWPQKKIAKRKND